VKPCIFPFSSPPAGRPKTLPSSNEGGSYSRRKQHQSRIDYQEDPANEQFATDQGSNCTKDQAASTQRKGPKSNGDVLPHQQRAQDPSYNWENFVHQPLLSIVPSRFSKGIHRLMHKVTPSDEFSMNIGRASTIFSLSPRQYRWVLERKECGLPQAATSASSASATSAR
jgi:hypothetical protein